MFIFTWYKEGLFEVAGNIQAIVSLCNTFENNGLEFKVSTRNGPILPIALGLGDFKYWLPQDKSFGACNET